MSSFVLAVVHCKNSGATKDLRFLKVKTSFWHACWKSLKLEYSEINGN